MTAETLLERIHAAGATIEPRGDRLCVKAPAPLPDDLLAELRAYKRELVSLLCGELPVQEAQVLPEEASGERLSALLRRQPVVQVNSKVLGEMVLWAADNAQVPADNTLVVYREAELRQMAGRSPEELRAIHATKKALDGEVIQA